MNPLLLNQSQKAEYLEAARLACYWLINSQNTTQRPWGEIYPEDSADLGRFLEKTCLSRNYRKPAGIWLTGLYLCGLCDILNTPVLDKHLYENAITCGAKFLKSLQCYDCRYPKGIGGFHEIYPGHTYSAPRDGATGAYALLSLYEKTLDSEYLDAAIAFAKWYQTYGSDQNGYPYDDFDLKTGVGKSKYQADWMAGGAIVYYRLYKITKDNNWLKAFEKVLIVLYANMKDKIITTETGYDFHGDTEISVGNDDFANIILLMGHHLFKDKKYLDLAISRLKNEISRQDSRGAFPNYGGTLVTSIELLETIKLLTSLNIETANIELFKSSLHKSAKFSLTLQELNIQDRYVTGGLYGQSNYSYGKDIIHGRDTGYAIYLWISLAGYKATTYLL